jgi:hypothetical protein
MSDTDEFKEVVQKNMSIKIDEHINNDSSTNSCQNSLQNQKKKNRTWQTNGLIIFKFFSIILLITVAGAAALFVWPTKWRNDTLTIDSDQFPVRVNRFTGQTEVLYPEGWEEIKSETLSTSIPQPVDSEELRKIEGQLSISSSGYVAADLYNGTSKPLKSVQIRLVISDKDGDIEINRIYEANTSEGGELKSSKFTFLCGCTVKESQDFSWTIANAMWK